MLIKLLAFEFRSHARQVVFRAAAIIFFMLGLVMAPRGFGSTTLAPNGTFSIIYLISIMSLGLIIAIALFAGHAVLRDRDHKMEGIVYTTAITHFQYVVSRFVGLVGAVFLVMIAFALGLLIGLFMPWTDAEQLVSIRLWPYLWALFVMVLPNILVGSALIFATAALTKNALATYISGIFLYILYAAGSMLGNSPIMAAANATAGDPSILATLLEPYGLVGFMEQTRYWTVLQKNSQLLALEGPFLFNRLLWIGFSLLLFALTYRYFGFRALAVPKVKALPAERQSVAAIDYRPLPQAGLNLITGRLAAYWRQTKICFRTTIFAYSFYALLMMWTFFTLVTIGEQGISGDLGIPLHPYTGILLPVILEPMLRLGALVMVFYAGELVWNERKWGVAGLLDTCPQANLTFWAAKITALVWIVFCLVAWTILLTVFFQIYHGHGSLDLGVHFSLFVRAGIPLVLIGVLAVAIQSWIPNRYAGMAAAFLVVVLFSGVVLSRSPGIAHPMLRYAFTPEFQYSPMAGMGYHDPALFWFLAYWSAVAGLLAMVTLKIWPRGQELRVTRFNRIGRLGASIYVIGALTLAGATFYQTNIAQSYRSEKAAWDRSATYERRYGGDAMVATVTPVDLDVKVDIYPAKRAFTAEGHMVLENQTGASLDTLLIGFRPEVGTHKLDLEGATLVHTDDEFRHYRYRFEEALSAGDKRSLAFSIRVERRSFQGLNPEIYVLEQASYIELEKVLPFFGYHSGLAIVNPVERRKRGLPVVDAFPPIETAMARLPDRARIRAVVTTAKDQTVVAPGLLVDSWQEGDRAHFRFDTQEPVVCMFGIAAAVYEVKKELVGETELSVYFAPGHDYNVAGMLSGARRALDYFQRHFGPYPFDGLKVAELPSFSGTFAATAYPGTIFAVEDRQFLLHQSEHSLDLVGRGMAHEIGHQWWGQQIDPALVAGFRLLTEVLAEYSELVVYEETHGREGTLAFLEKTNDLYFFYRGYEDRPELPLSRVQNQPYIYYFKGAHVMYVLRELVGEERINGVLREMLRDFCYPRKPTAADLITKLWAATEPELHAAMDELFNQVVTYDLKTLAAEGRVLANGDFQVNIQMQALKTSLDDAGNERVSPVLDWVEVGLWQEGELLYTEQIYLEGETQNITLITQHRPDAFSIDPRRLKLDPDPHDNHRRITVNP